MDTSSDLQSCSSNPNSSGSSQDTSSTSAYWNFNQQQESLAAELERLPVPFMVNVLDEMCHSPELVQIQRQVLSNPLNVCKILRCVPNARIKLTVYFQWMEKLSKNFVWNMVQNVCGFITQSTELSDGHLLGFRSLLKLGQFFVESGWYAEAIALLHTVKLHQTKGRPMKVLQVLKILVLAEALSNRDEAAFVTISSIHTLVGLTKGIPMSFTAEMHCTLTVSYFEICEFNASYQQGLLALQLLGEEICPHETIIETFRQLGKSCIPNRRPYQAKLLITQAVSWAWHNFGSTSVTYAEALEDYAFYLLMMDAYEDAVKVITEVKDIYYGLYGHLGLQAELAQGNLAFRLYLESNAFLELGTIFDSLDCLGDLEDNQRKMEITESDDRQLVAIGRMRPIMAVRDLSRERFRTAARDEIENVQPQSSVNDIRRLFFTNFA